MIDLSDLLRRSTTDERIRGSSVSWPSEARKLLDAARRHRACGDHVVAGMCERDAAAYIRMARENETIRLVATRLRIDLF